ncbi:MAG: hypothetical protein ACOC1K_01030 [Nanoarchaeota archaeon]
MKNKKIKKRNKKGIPIIKVIQDIIAYRKWIKTINNEAANPKSLYNKYEIKSNLFYNIYVGVTLPDEDKVLPDNIKRLRVVESLAPVHRYIDSDLGFADFIVPEFNQVYTDEGAPTLTYIVLYRFSFKRLNISFIISRILFWATIVILYFNINWEQLYTWITNLI